jgi:hypothetical protein
LIALVVTWGNEALAQVPPRSYWKTLSGGNAVPVIYMPMNGNANPFDPAYTLVPGARVEATMAPVGYIRTLAVLGRAATAAIFIPMGRLAGDVTVLGTTFSEQASGFGDPMVEFGINVIGKAPIRNIPDLLRYEPGFSLDVIVDLAIPIGEYNSEGPLNVGQNRWYGRVGTPIVLQVGPWVPSRRTTLEFLPSLWLFGPNDDYVGSVLKTDPMFQLEGHLTRDFAKGLWGSLDGTWVTGGQASIDGVEGEKLNNVALGYTLGYHVNDNIQVTFGYMSTVNDNEPQDLQLDGFKVSVVFGWHPLVEGMKRLEGGE